mmetsp:Transcript_17709/g.55463  ORF Transcript_17709/g.55463 Transcript_17709/m.55463 type:complete len:211 (-) Transcript_17709:117-749(-)
MRLAVVLAVVGAVWGRDYYAILGLPKTASGKEIKKAYRDLALKHHPDKNPENREAAEAKFREVAEAYEVLGDETRRRQYDAGRYDAGGARQRRDFRSADEIFKEFFGTNDPFANFDKVFGDSFGSAFQAFGGGFGGSASFTSTTTTVGADGRTYTKTVRSTTAADGRTQSHASVEETIGGRTTRRVEKSSHSDGPSTRSARRRHKLHAGL